MQPKHILIVKSSSMGDIVHALPVAYDIKKAFPDARLDWVAEEAFQDIPKLSPFVDGVIVTAFRRWRRELCKRETLSEVAEVRRQLRDAHYDAVIDLQGLIRSAVVTSWANARSYGYSRDVAREPLASFFYSEKFSVPEVLRPVRRYRVLASRALGYGIDEDAPRYGLAVGATPPGIELPANFVALAPNTSRVEKLWAEDRWVALGKRFLDVGLTPAFFWGSDEEKQRVERLAQKIGSSVVLPRMRLADCAAVIAKAHAMIGVDTGLAHLGAALAVPSVGIIVGTSAHLFSLVSEGKAVTVGDKGVVPSVDAVWRAYEEVVK